MAGRLKCLFYNCLLNYDSLFPDGALPSTCTQSLLVQSYSTSRWSSSPSPCRATERKSYGGGSHPLLRLQPFSNDVIYGLNLSLPRPGITLRDTRGQSVSCGWLPHLSMPQAARSECILCWIKESPQTAPNYTGDLSTQPISAIKRSSLLFGLNSQKQKCSCHWSQRRINYTDLLESKGKDARFRIHFSTDTKGILIFLLHLLKILCQMHNFPLYWKVWDLPGSFRRRCWFVSEGFVLYCSVKTSR